MAKWEAKNIVLTSEGRIALSKVQSGDGFLTITRVVASSQYVDPVNLEQVTVIDPQNMELDIISRRESGDGGSVIQVMLDNVNLAEEFILNQIGVFASHSSNPQVEFLYIIAQVSENSGDRVPVYSDTPVSCTYDIFLYNVKASDIVVNISPNFFVTADDLFSNAKVLRRSFPYEEGDIAYDSTLRSCYNLKCVVAGTSKSQTIDFSTYTKGDKITDGEVVWKVIEGTGGGADGKWSCDKTDLYNVIMRPLTPAEQEDEPDEEEKHTFQEIVDSAISGVFKKVESINKGLTNHEESENPHPNFLKKGEEVTTADNLVCGLSEDSKELNHISMVNLKKQMLGDISNDIPLLNSRVRQLERENANLALKMEAENMMPDCNMLLAENFDGAIDDTNRTKIKVISGVSGDDSVDVESVYNLRIGDWIWVSDGLHSEYRQIKSTIKNGGVYRVILTSVLNETYVLDDTYIYFTTCDIDNGVCMGSTDILSKKYTGETWSGSRKGGTAESNVKLDTSLDNADSFSIDGDGVFNESGLISVA